MVRSSATRLVGGGLGPAPLAAVAVDPPAAHPASGTPLCSALGWVFRSADRTNAPPPCGLTYGGCPLLLPAGGCGSQQRDSSGGGGGWAPPPWRPLLWTPPRRTLHRAPPSVAPWAGFSGLPTVLTPRPLMG